MKKLRLKSWVKVVLSVVIVVSLSLLFLKVAIDRAEAIDNGDITIISESYMK